MEAISLLMLSRAAVKTLGTKMKIVSFFCCVGLFHVRVIVLRSADGVECALERTAWVARSGENSQLMSSSIIALLSYGASLCFSSVWTISRIACIRR